MPVPTVDTTAACLSSAKEGQTSCGSDVCRLAARVEPGPRALSPLAYDAESRSLVLFGGDRLNELLGDTWVYDGKRWSRRDVAGPPARRLAVSGTVCGRVVLFGGWDGREPLGDTWEWDGARWAWRDVPGPSAR